MAEEFEDAEPEQEPGHTEELFVRARDGDGEAWSQLVAYLRPSLERVFHGRLPIELRGRVDTGDLIQIGLARAAKNADKFEPRAPGSARAWLHSLLRNALTDMTREHFAQLRDARRECRGDELFSGLSGQGSNEDPEQLAEQMDSWARLLLQVSELPHVDREIVLRHTLEEQSFPEIAAALNMPESTVKDRYVKALRVLQRRNRDYRIG